MKEPVIPKNPSDAGGVSPLGFSSDEMWASLVKAWASMNVQTQEKLLVVAVKMTPGDPALAGVKIDEEALMEVVEEYGLARKRRLDS